MEGAVVQITPGRGLGFFALGASLHEILTRLKAQPHLYPSIHIIYSSHQPLSAPVLISLPSNGFRLRFDGPEQRLRLVEVLDFTKSKLTYKYQELLKHTTSASPSSGSSPSAEAGPTFRHVYQKLFGPTFEGEYIPPVSDAAEARGTYILSYPGIAFKFPFQSRAWSSKKDFVSLLSSSAASAASAMVIYRGKSWPDARQELFSDRTSIPRSPIMAGKASHAGPDEIDLVRVHGEGRVELVRQSGKSSWIIFGETTPQDLVTEFGAPDAIYRKNDRRLSIHGDQTGAVLPLERQRRVSTSEDEAIDDTGHSPSQTNTDDSDDDSGSAVRSPYNKAASELFYNYFRHGFDVFVSTSAGDTPGFPSEAVNSQIHLPSMPTISRRTHSSGAGHATATKLLLHGNVPGSYPFNRYRRSRWTLELSSATSSYDERLNSETPFNDISRCLRDRWKDMYRDESEERHLQRGMVLNRGWGDSPGSSCELIGGWDEPLGSRSTEGGRSGSNRPLGNTELYGFPGMVFEVLVNGAVSCLTVF